MRFIAEFETAKYKTVLKEYTDACKSRYALDIGKMASESFGWQNPVNENKYRHRLEIEAFPVERWVEFKSRLFSNFIDHDYEHAEEILMIIKELESFGKPAGEQA